MEAKVWPNYSSPLPNLTLQFSGRLASGFLALLEGSLIYLSYVSLVNCQGVKLIAVVKMKGTIY